MLCSLRMFSMVGPQMVVTVLNIPAAIRMGISGVIEPAR